MKIRILISFAFLSTFLVVFLYIYQFGFGLWSDHTKWAELGSFFGGVLGPILAFFSLLYLAFQVEMQWKESKEARIESEISNRESNISTNLKIIEPRLIKDDSLINAPFKELILRIYRDKDLENKNFEEIKWGLSARSETMVLWLNISAALSYIKKVDEARYLNQLILVQVKLDRELCRALDRVVKIATDIKFENHFYHE